MSQQVHINDVAELALSFGVGSAVITMFPAAELALSAGPAPVVSECPEGEDADYGTIPSPLLSTDYGTILSPVGDFEGGCI